MTTLRQAAEQAIKWAENHGESVFSSGGMPAVDKMNVWTAALRHALEADTKPCACCGDGNSRLSVTRICDTCGSEYAGQAEMDMAKRIEADHLEALLLLKLEGIHNDS